MSLMTSIETSRSFGRQIGLQKQTTHLFMGSNGITTLPFTSTGSQRCNQTLNIGIAILDGFKHFFPNSLPVLVGMIAPCKTFASLLCASTYQVEIHLEMGQ